MIFKRDPSKLYRHDRWLARTVLPLIPKGVTPNMVTGVRFALIPVVLWLLMTQNWSWGVPLFLIAAATDALDGSLARTRHQITAWGSFYDPVADKLLIGSIIIFVVAQVLGSPIVIAVLLIDVLIAAGGFLARQRGMAVSANSFGKAKMILQVTGVTVLLFALWFHQPTWYPAAMDILILSIGFAVMSLFTYGL